MVLNEDFYEEAEDDIFYNLITAYTENKSPLFETSYNNLLLKQTLYENERVIDRFKDIIADFMDIIIDNEHNYNKKIDTGYSYKTFYDKLTHKKYVDLDLSENHNNELYWHKIFIIISLNIPGKSGSYRNLSDNSLLNKNDDIIIIINPLYIISGDALEEYIYHELNHICVQFSNDEYDPMNTLLGNISKAKNDFSFMTDKIFNELIKRYLYVLSPYERNAFLTETYAKILNFNEDKLFELIEKYKNKQDLLDELIRLTYTANRFNIMMNLYKMIKDINVNKPTCIYLLIVNYYLHKHGLLKTSDKYSNIEFINKFYNNDQLENISNKELSDIKYSVLNKLYRIFDRYESKLAEYIFNALKEKTNYGIFNYIKREKH